MKALLFVVCSLFIVVANAQNCKAYLPYSKGTTWEMRTYNAKNKEIGIANYELIDLVEKAGATTFTVKVLSKIGRKNDVHENIYTAKCENGKFEFDMKQMMSGMSMESFQDMDIKVDASELEMPPLEAAVGTKLKDGSLSVNVKNGGIPVFNMKMNITERIVEAQEKKETAAGEFDCIKITQHITTTMIIPIDMVTKEWHAEGIGLVASETYSKKGKLASYMKLTQFDK